MITVPWQNSASFKEEVTLEDTPYIFRFDFNSVGNFWIMGISDRDEVELLTGVKLVLGTEILTQHPDRGLPPGMMFVIDETGNTEPIEQNDFINNRVKLTYATEAEVEAA
tara:strand:+ start:12057 stop:12386 length:330 start_codon:yes stop_codon:yes gene_type:complete